LPVVERVDQLVVERVGIEVRRSCRRNETGAERKGHDQVPEHKSSFFLLNAGRMSTRPIARISILTIAQFGLQLRCGTTQ
jgi:hypothetical protein